MCDIREKGVYLSLYLAGSFEALRVEVDDAHVLSAGTRQDANLRREPDAFCLRVAVVADFEASRATTRCRCSWRCWRCRSWSGALGAALSRELVEEERLPGAVRTDRRDERDRTAQSAQPRDGFWLQRESGGEVRVGEEEREGGGRGGGRLEAAHHQCQHTHPTPRHHATHAFKRRRPGAERFAGLLIAYPQKPHF